ncbi:MAG TPA: hypothetical protein PLN61_02130 [bacterium]|nr:hypothetical protein [bacterium]HQI47434.1 hypothetical protein [bacterium]HQJ64675.1 hypothetical protein [bacterium]
MDFIIVGEDIATREIIKRLISQYCSHAAILREEPARGSEIQAQIRRYNMLAESYPIFVLTDEDGECPPNKIQSWFGGDIIAPQMLFRVAVDEAESWLLADHSGFSNYFRIANEEIPLSAVRGNEKEVSFSIRYKTSLFIMLELVPKSRSASVREQLTPRNRAHKGPAYNSAMVPFIINKWNPEMARQNSSSLDRAIIRLLEFCS